MLRTRTLAAIILAWACCAGTASAQLFGRKAQAPPAASIGGAMTPPRVSITSPAKADERVITAGQEIPEPNIPDQMQPAQVQLPTEPINAYLLPRDAGPFLVNAQAFRGPQSSQFAQLLAMELRRDYQIPAYVYNSKMKPGNSNIQGIPPTSPADGSVSGLNGPERYRIQDEAVVLVGNCKSEDEAEGLLKQVKKIQPKCLQGMPSIYPWRKKDLGRATITVNPLVASQQLFTKKADPLVKRLNAGPHSISNCPGAFTLQVSEFSGRSTFMMQGDQALDDEATLKTSPLANAADDAEALATLLEKNPDFQKLGLKAYVFHDRTDSKVTVGSFSAPNAQQFAALGLTPDPREPGKLIAAPGSRLLDIMLKMNLNDKFRNGTKVENLDVNVARAKFLRMDKEMTKNRETTAPVLFQPRIIEVPRF